jgi:CRISPR-associated endonuclease/helicase Cas3
MKMTEALYYRYRGKASSDNENGAKYHLLPYHCLDVAAVGCILLERYPFLANRFEQLFGLPKEVLFPWLNLLLALHDCGKFAEIFQQLKPELRENWWGAITKTSYDLRHDNLGFVLWEDQTALRKLASIDSDCYRNNVPHTRGDEPPKR